MKINIKDSGSNSIIQYEANSSENEREPGWTVILPAGNSIFITQQLGEWKVRHDETVNSNLVCALGEAINVYLIQDEKTKETGI